MTVLIEAHDCSQIDPSLSGLLVLEHVAAVFVATCTCLRPMLSRQIDLSNLEHLFKGDRSLMREEQTILKLMVQR